jgi:peptide/nickel transport system ATP-binding protein
VVFQDPNRSLNPRRKVIDSIVEGALNFGMGRAEALALAAELMAKVRLPRESLQRYPSQFSGGQRQRIAIARALACRPRVLVADEAVSALDVSVQAQILTLLREIRDELGLGLLFITHDLRVAAQLCDRVIVMHQGRIVEQGPTAALYAQPAHDYTRQLAQGGPGRRARPPPFDARVTADAGPFRAILEFSAEGPRASQEDSTVVQPEDLFAVRKDSATQCQY